MTLQELISSWDFGTVPEWVGALGTIAALGWAVFLYQRSIEDKEISQARRLSILMSSLWLSSKKDVTANPESVSIWSGVLVHQGKAEENGECVWKLRGYADIISVHLRSTSDETFYEVEASVIQVDGSLLRLSLGTSILEPNASIRNWNYFPSGTVRGKLRMRVRFQDAGGRYWVRYNDEPVRRLKKSEIRGSDKATRSRRKSAK